MKFVHASDVHLDSPVRGLPLYPGAPVDAFAGATRRAFVRLVDLCIAERADLLLLAGDLVDGSGRDHKTGLFFVEQMLRLEAAGVRVLSVRGNHDAASRVIRTLLLPENVHELGVGAVETRLLPELGVAVHGRSYPEPAVFDDLTSEFPPPVPGFVNVGLLHTSAEGGAAHDPYAPCSRRALRRRGYEYWALGHIHGRTILSRDPWIVFPGNLQGRGLHEPGPKGATVVTVEEHRVREVRPASVDVARFGTCTVGRHDAASVDEVTDVLAKRLAAAATAHPDLALGIRVVLTGEAAVASFLSLSPERRMARLRDVARATPGCVWIEGLFARIEDGRGPAFDLGPKRDLCAAA